MKLRTQLRRDNNLFHKVTDANGLSRPFSDKIQVQRHNHAMQIRHDMLDTTDMSQDLQSLFNTSQVATFQIQSHPGFHLNKFSMLPSKPGKSPIKEQALPKSILKPPSKYKLPLPEPAARG